jgi:hypothetical protein
LLFLLGAAAVKQKRERGEKKGSDRLCLIPPGCSAHVR